MCLARCEVPRSRKVEVFPGARAASWARSFCLWSPPLTLQLSACCHYAYSLEQGQQSGGQRCLTGQRGAQIVGLPAGLPHAPLSQPQGRHLTRAGLLACQCKQSPGRGSKAGTEDSFVLTSVKIRWDALTHTYWRAPWRKQVSFWNLKQLIIEPFVSDWKDNHETNGGLGC